MQEKDLTLGKRCPIRTTLEMLGGKWKLLIIYRLSEKPLRFGELKRAIGSISEKMLVQELKCLEVDGLVLRNNYGEVPPRVDYRLTNKGRLALPLIREMRRFAQEYGSM